MPLTRLILGAVACGWLGCAAPLESPSRRSTEPTEPTTDPTTSEPTSAPLGTHGNPHRVDALPYAASGDTRDSDERHIDRYACGESAELGAEVWYLVEGLSPGRLIAEVDEVAGDGVDVDVHLLTATSADACLARDDARAEADVEAGVVYVVVDTWADSAGVEYPGPYELTVRFIAETTESSSCPPDMVAIDGFCIDRYEAHLVGHDPTQVATGGVAANAAGALPQGYVSGLVAADACEAAGKRLCTIDEWRRACEGPDGTTYPYGDTYDPDACNEGRSTHPVIDVFGGGATFSFDQLNDPRLNLLPDSLARSGDYAACVSAEGVADLHGNLHEWIDDPAGTFVGGFYVDASTNGLGCGYTTTAHSVDYHDYSTGFRCCAGIAP